MIVTLRKLIPEDAEELLLLQHKLDEESTFMLLEPDERKSGLQQVREMIEDFVLAETSVLIGAEADGVLVGFMSLRGGSVRRNRHCAYVVVGISKQYQGMGIGTALFDAMEEWAAEHCLIRIELTVMTHNQRALDLYHKSGFRIEGTRVKSLKVDGCWVDEYYMGKIIEK